MRRFVPGRTGFGRGTISSFPKERVVSAIGTSMSIMPKGNQVLFASGRKPGSLRMRCKIYLGTITYNTSGNTSFAIGASDTAGQWYYVPSNFQYFGSGVVPRMAQYFDNYYQHQTTLQFCSAINTTGHAYQVTWCFCDSYDHWERIGVSNADSQLSKAQILSMSNSRSFPAWEPDMRISIPANPTRFSTASPAGTGALINFGTMPAAALRQSVSATAGIKVTGTFPTEDTIIGDIYVHVDIELMDMGGLLNTGPTLLATVPRLSKIDKDIKLRCEGELERKEEVISKLGEKSSSRKLSAKTLSDDFTQLSMDDEYEPGAPRAVSPDVRSRRGKSPVRKSASLK